MHLYDILYRSSTDRTVAAVPLQLQGALDTGTHVPTSKRDMHGDVQELYLRESVGIQWKFDQEKRG